MNRQENRGGVLSSYRTLDLTDEKGMRCSRLLADMGTDVIRIDTPGEDSPYSHLNAGKRSITLNLESRRGKEIFRRLIKTADVVVESYQPGYYYPLADWHRCWRDL